MGSKVIFLQGFLFVIVVLISSIEAGKTNGLDDAKYSGGDGGYGGYSGRRDYGGSYPGRGGYGGYTGGGDSGGSYSGGGGYGGSSGHGGYGDYPDRGIGCRYGCCDAGYGGGCYRCCSYANEAVEAKPQN